MESWYFDMAGLKLCLQTPRQLPMTERLQSFVCQPCQPDCTIRVRPGETLPQPGEAAVSRGPLDYQGVRRIFHRSAPGQQVAAVTTLEPSGDILLEYLPEYESWFSGFSGIFNRIGMELLLLHHGGLLLHASVVSHGGQGILFTGPSGIGKSTQAALWHSTLGAQILNGDRAGLRKRDGTWCAYGLPYAGSSGIYRNQWVPVKALVVLKQAKENRIRQLRVPEAFRAVFGELAVHRWNREFVEQATELLLQLLGGVRIYELECVPEESAVRLLEGMLI